MATTPQDVFEIAMSIMDELSDSGEADTADTAEYKNRTLSILNVLAGELYPYSDTFEYVEDGVRPIVPVVDEFTDSIGLDDYCCRSILPYGLVAHLLLDENPTSASYCQQRYDELKATLSRGMPQISEDIYDAYGPNGGLWPYNDFGMWR